MSYSISTLKIALGISVTENKKLTKEQKVKVLEFIQNGTDSQVQHLALTGEVKKVFTEAEKKQLQEKIESSKLIKEQILTEGPVGSILGMMIFTPFIWAAWRTIAGLVSSKRRKCGMYRISEERDKCIDRVNIFEYQKKIDVINKAAKDCPKNKDPKRCQAKHDYALDKMKAKLKKAEDKYKMRWGQAAVK
jgi:hypothetical protein